MLSIAALRILQAVQNIPRNEGDLRSTLPWGFVAAKGKRDVWQQTPITRKPSVISPPSPVSHPKTRQHRQDAPLKARKKWKNAHSRAQSWWLTLVGHERIARSKPCGHVPFYAQIFLLTFPIWQANCQRWRRFRLLAKTPMIGQYAMT